MQLIVVFTCLAISAASVAQSDATVACYMDASIQHMVFPVDSFSCTHIIYSTAYISDDFSFKTLSLDVDLFSSMLKSLKERNPGLKILLGIGLEQSRLEVLLQQQIILDNFLNSLLKYVMKNSYDGVELTWLENDSDETLRNTETLTRFIKELNWTNQAADKSLLVLVSLLDHNDHISTLTDKKTLSQYADFICILPLSSNNKEPQIDNTVNYWQTQVDPKKLIIALPAIVQQPQKRQSTNQSRIVGINPERKVEQMNGPGLIIGKKVCQAIKSGQKELKTLTNRESAQSHGEDVSWFLQKGLGGVGVITLDIDNFLNSVCLNCTTNEKAILGLNVITGHQHGHGHHGHRHHGHRHHGHRHRRHHHHGHRHHGHRHHGHGHHGHHHHGHGHHGHGHHRHSPHSNSHNINSHHN
ncbi:histidine-rich carboxyl terminus protein 1 [Neoarius graeffei]|uniref:histidine-rich carboxyl terminus protein 1 n=1 Tax=Neoarius graeffei TaxID=443677 RepID=UPI00298D4E22|nr:histidine-rich carboxyl terminus protein 1 [Neoarius graeffei]